MNTFFFHYYYFSTFILNISSQSFFLIIILSPLFFLLLLLFSFFFPYSLSLEPDDNLFFEQEVALKPYRGTFHDYAEAVVQFGYVNLFSVVSTCTCVCVCVCVCTLHVRTHIYDRSFKIWSCVVHNTHKYSVLLCTRLTDKYDAHLFISAVE